MSKIPGFNAGFSLYKPTQSYQSVSLTTTFSSVIPQAVSRGRFGGFGGFGGSLGLDPLPSSCSECRYTCSIVSCGPNCRREECADVCQSVPCIA